MNSHSRQSAQLSPCQSPTFFFIGVTTGQSSIMSLFPKWSDILGLGAVIAGYDAPIQASAESYRAIVRFIKQDPLAMGALVTTHKIDLLEATRDLFDSLDPYAALCNEVSCICKRDGRLAGYALDPISSGLAWQAFVPAGHWGSSKGHVLCIGAGGTAVAISVYLAGLSATDRPHKVIFVERSPSRLEHLQLIHGRLASSLTFEYFLNQDPARNDAVMASLPPGSMVINATGMGKDRPGSPISDDGVFPENGLVWELNYRGALDFLRQARRQADQRQLLIVDGWGYFVHGWSQAIAQVFELQLTPKMFNQLERAAAGLRSLK